MINNNDLQDRELQRNAAMAMPGAQLSRLVAMVFCAVFVTSIAIYGMTAGTGVSLGLFGLIALIVARGLWYYPLDTFGAANSVTTVRAGMVAMLAGTILQPEALDVHGWTLFWIASIAFALDGVDGFLARRSGTASSFGARFDMEIDALFGAVLSLIALSAGIAGPEILILGFMRYAFVAASYLLPWLSGDLPDSIRRKTVCVVQIAVLIALICPLMPTGLNALAAWGGIAALVWSFGVDTLWLKRAAA